MTDFGVVVLSRMALVRESLSTASSLAEATGLPMPSVSKVLKLLTRAQVVTSHRGVNGGYSLARPAEQITVEQIIAALEGPVALTSCVDGTCGVETLCPLHGRWDKVNEAIRGALHAITLAEIAVPPPGLSFLSTAGSDQAPPTEPARS
jgi:FeS assembly SUF system regulator